MRAPRPNPAILEEPAQMRWAKPLSSVAPRPLTLELLDTRGRRFATLKGEQERELRERAARWPDAIGLALVPGRLRGR